MTDNLDDPKGERTAAAIDWTPQDADPLATVHCNCGARYRSHVKFKLVPRGRFSRKPCPGCGSHCDIRRAESDPETVTLSGAQHGSERG